MRWTVLTDDHLPASGGVAVWTDRVVRGLRQAGHEVQVFARRRPHLPPDVAPVWAPRFSRWGHVAMAWSSRGLEADRLLCTTWTLVPPRLRGADVVVHGSDVTRPTHDPARRRRVLQRSRVWAVSHWLRRLLRERFGVEARVLPAPVPTAMAPAPPGERWCWMGRAAPGKGGERFVRWLRAAGAEGLMIGHGPRLQAWARSAEQEGVTLRCTGWLPPRDALKRLRGAKLLALCPDPASEHHGDEGLGLVGLEALGQGLPVVGVGVGGVPEAVGPGLVVPKPDDVDDVRARIEAWWTPQRGEEGWHWVRKHHGTPKTVAALMEAS